MGGRDVNARAYLSKFNFTEPIKREDRLLSGGERNRLPSCHGVEGGKAMWLLLDEPTTTSMSTHASCLEEGLDDFAGCAVVVSHDRCSSIEYAPTFCRLKATANVVFYEAPTPTMKSTRKPATEAKRTPRRRYRKLME